MNHKAKPPASRDGSLSTPAPISKLTSTVGLSVVIMGFWNVGASLAQFPASTIQPPVSYAIYEASQQTGLSAIGHSSNLHVSTSSNSPATWIVPASTSIASDAVSSITTTYPLLTIRNWALDVANAQQSLNQDRLPDIGTSRRRLDQAMMQLENLLATSPQQKANWLAFLTWDELRTELKNEMPDQDRLLQFEKTFRQNYRGLEMRQFTDVRDALASYSQALKFSSDRSKTLEIFSNRLIKLTDQLQLPNRAQDFESTREIGQTIAYLFQGNQAPALVNAVRGTFSKSNARVLLSSEFVNKRFSRPVNEANPVNELILGTQIYGQSCLQGWVTPQLIDCNTNAALKVNLNGSFSSQNIGYNRSVKLHTQGFANVAASETIALTDGGLVPLNDPSINAALSSQINDIEARLRIVRKIATKQAAKQKPQADAIAQGRLETRIQTQFHERLSQQIGEANQRIKAPDLVALTRLGLERPKRTSWSSPQYLALLWKLQGQAQLAAPTACPLLVVPTGITVQLHESVLTNLLDPVLAGRILKSTELDSLAAQFGDALGKKQVLQKESEPWAVTLANFHPVEVQLDNALITFRIRTNKLDRGDQALDQPASIEASYGVVFIDGTIQLQRQGDVKIDFSGKQQRGVRAVTLRSFLKKKFEEVFKQELLDQPLRLSDRLPIDLRGMYVSSIVVDDGWIQAHVLE